MFSFETREVVITKTAAAEWAWELFPQWRALIAAAQKSYARQASVQEEAFMRAEVKELYRFACERIEGAGRGQSANQLLE